MCRTHNTSSDVILLSLSCCRNSKFWHFLWPLQFKGRHVMKHWVKKTIKETPPKIHKNCKRCHILFLTHQMDINQSIENSINPLCKSNVKKSAIMNIHVSFTCQCSERLFKWVWLIHFWIYKSNGIKLLIAMCAVYIISVLPLKQGVIALWIPVITGSTPYRPHTSGVSVVL